MGSNVWLEMTQVAVGAEGAWDLQEQEAVTFIQTHNAD
jgi:hypothetical protein